jgi:hypothetical protein
MVFPYLYTVSEQPLSHNIGLKETNRQIPHRERHTGNDKACRYTGTKLNKRSSFSVHDGVAGEYQVV